MANYYVTALPIVGVTPGPAWATTLNTIMTLLEGHAHVGDDEQKITQNAISLTGDLDLKTFNTKNAGASRLKSQTLATLGTNTFGLMVDQNGDLWYETAAPNTPTQIKLTSGTSINVAQATNTGISGSGYNASSGAQINWQTGGLPSPFYGAYKNSTLTDTNLAGWRGSYLDLRNTLGDMIWLRDQTGKNGLKVTATNPSSYNGLSISFDATNAGTYLLNAFQLVNDQQNNQYLLGLNAGVSPIYPIDAFRQVTTNAGRQVIAGLNAVTTGGAGTPATGFGPSLVFRAPSSAGVYTGLAPLGVIDALWNTVSGTNTGNSVLRLHAYSNLGPSNTAGIEVAGYGGTDYVGVGGAAVSGQALTVYGSTLPSAGSSYDLGASGTRWSHIYTDNLLVNTTATFNGTLQGASATFSSTVTASAAVTGTSVVPTATATGPVAGAGGLFKSNQVLAFGTVLANASIANNFGFISGGVAFTGGTCTIVLGTTPSSAVVLVSLTTSAASKSVAPQASISGNTITVFTWDGAGTSNNEPFSFVVIGQP